MNTPWCFYTENDDSVNRPTNRTNRRGKKMSENIFDRFDLGDLVKHTNWGGRL